jgi:hypothetical protein
MSVVAVARAGGRTAPCRATMHAASTLRSGRALARQSVSSPRSASGCQHRLAYGVDRHFSCPPPLPAQILAFCCSLDYCSAFRVSPCSFATISRGVLAGRNNPNQIGYSAFAIPASSVVGTSGSADDRFDALVARLAPYPLLLLDNGYGLRRAFDAACRLAGLRPNIRLETRSPHTLLALAESKHGVAIIATTFRAHRYNLKIVRIVYRSRPLREPLAILWDKRRPLPRYATAFCQMWAEHVRAVFPITGPTIPKAGTAPKQAKGR